MWVLAAMYFCYGYAVNMFLAWYPKYLDAARGYTLAEMGFFASLTLGAAFIGDICGGLFSDMIIRRTGRIKFARQSVAITGFLIAAVFIPVGCWTTSPYATAAMFGLGLFGMELVVGNSWAVTLDIGGSFAGSCSAVMKHLRQYRRRYCGGCHRLHRQGLWLECGLLCRQRALPAGRLAVHPHRCRPQADPGCRHQRRDVTDEPAGA